MSQLPSKKELKQLAKFNEPNCISIYMPYIEPTGSSNPNKIELKNLMRQAHKQLLATGLKPSLVEKTLKPIQSLLDGKEFWPVRRESFAIFAHSKFFKYFHVPGRKFERNLSINQGFSLEPIKSLAEHDKTYMVLALGHTNVRLYKANRYQISPIALKGFPSDMMQTLHIDELPRVLETHPVATAERGKASQSFHGQYNVAQTDKTMLLQFFRQINRHLHEFLQGKKVPVVLAGVGYLLPLYHSVNTYPHLVAKGVQGSPNTIDTEHLHKRAWRIATKWRNKHLPKRLGRSHKALT